MAGLLTQLLAASALLFAFNIVLSFFSGIGALEGMIFNHTSKYISDKHDTFVTPGDWTIVVWNVIFVPLAGAIIFVLLKTVGLKSNSQSNFNSWVFSRGPAISFIVNQLLYTSWLFVWDNEQLTAATILLAGVFISILVTFILFSRNLFKATEYLSCSSLRDLWIYRVLVQNSIGLYASWSALATLVSLASALVYEFDHFNNSASIISLGILSVAVLGWFTIDIFYYDRFFRYAITPYLGLTWGLASIIIHENELSEQVEASDNDEPPIYTVTALLSLVVLLSLAKLFVMLYRHNKTPYLR